MLSFPTKEHYHKAHMYKKSVMTVFMYIRYTVYCFVFPLAIER